MKQSITCSAEFKIISKQHSENMSANQNRPNEYHENQNPKSKKKFSKSGQEFINNISASGIKQFHLE